jgi:hypothetical protein
VQERVRDAQDLPTLRIGLEEEVRCLEADLAIIVAARAEELENANGCEQEAMSAIQSGRDDLAKLALQTHLHHTERAEFLAVDVEEYEMALTELSQLSASE